MTVKLRRYTDLSSLIDILVKNQIAVLSYQSWVDANDRKSMSVYQNTLHFGFVGALCLTEAVETFHHWQVFAKGSSGVCIVFDKDKFANMFLGHGAFSISDHLMAKSVEYIPISKIAEIDADDIHRLPFLKRIGFRDEREYRVIGFQPDGGISAMYVPLDPSSIIEVVFSPFVHPSLVISCKAALRSIVGWNNLEIKHSRLIDSQEWQQAIADFPRRHGSSYGPWITTEFKNVDL